MDEQRQQVQPEISQFSPPQEMHIDGSVYGLVQGEHNTVTITYQNSPQSSLTLQERQNRIYFLKCVRSRWITDVLEHSLYNASLLTLGLHEQSDAVKNPWHLVVQETDQSERPLPAGTRIIQIFDEADCNLLILGAPGAGKTTLLLELTRELLERAEKDVMQPLPAVFNLSSWGQKRQPLSDWLVAELQDKYHVPSKVATSWFAHDCMALLLDGLDEVALEHRVACMAALDTYRKAHGFVPLAVCSRSSEYLTQAVRLDLRKAVVIQPLTPDQIDDYLSIAGEQVAALRVAIHEDEDLQELATIPLMLNILMLTYRGMALEGLSRLKFPYKRQQRIFENYVERMLNRRNNKRWYTSQQTKHWLIKLARQMKQQGQSEFYIERLTMDWLINYKVRLLYRISCVLVCSVAGALIGGSIAWMNFGVISGLVTAALFSLPGGMASGFYPVTRTVEVFTWSWRAVRQKWFTMLILMIIAGVLSLLGVQSSGLAVDTLTISLVVSGLIGVMLGGLISGMMGGFVEMMPDMQKDIRPNQELRRSLRYSLNVVFICALFGMLFALINNGLGMLLAAACGLVGALTFGGLACIEHVVLRLFLWRGGVLPWKLARFLDYAAERILLRRIGGGYIFMHRLLLEYFASLDEDDANSTDVEM